MQFILNISILKCILTLKAKENYCLDFHGDVNFLVYQHDKADCFSDKWKNVCKLSSLIQKQDNLPGKTFKNHYMKCFYVAWELSYMKQLTYKKKLRQD